VPARQATQPGGVGSLESILGLFKSLKIRAHFHRAYIYCTCTYFSLLFSTGSRLQVSIVTDVEIEPHISNFVGLFVLVFVFGVMLDNTCQKQKH
jgi:hypothetical protein